MTLHVAVMSGRRANSMYKRMTRSPHGRVVVGQSANFANLAESASYPEASRSLVGDAAQVQAEAALFGTYPLIGIPKIIRDDKRFKAVLLSMTEDAAKTVVWVNGVGRDGKPLPGAVAVSNRVIASGAWQRWQLGPEYSNGKAYRIYSPSANFFPKLIEALDAVPGGKAAVAGSFLANFLTGGYPALWAKFTNSTDGSVAEAGAGLAQGAATTMTGGRGVSTGDIVQGARGAGDAALNTAKGAGMIIGGLILSSQLGPAIETPTGPVDPPEEEKESSPLIPLGIVGLVVAKLAGVF